MNTLDKYHAAVAFVESFSNYSIRKNTGKNKKDPGIFLDRTRYFLDLLGKPGQYIKYIHVTGTAGKGTVSTMLQKVLTRSGKKTGLFTSPYVTAYIEKISVDGKYISPSDFIKLVDYVKPFIRKAQKGPYGVPSAFELDLIIALLYFKSQRCDWVVLEAGLGGRYDATNVIARPVATAITNIDYDHTEILGNTLRKIATDKAGIIKSGSPFFTSEQRPTLLNLFKRICTQKGSEFFSIPHQKEYSDYNVELVRTMCRYIGIVPRCIEDGIRRTALPCRFEIMNKNPLVILDGAHNRAKIRSTISNLQKHEFKKLYLIISIADNKHDNRAIVQPLVQLPYPLHIVLTKVSIGERKTLSTKLLVPIATKFKRMGTKVETIDDALGALQYVLQMATKEDAVVVTGSFFLTGELRKQWISEEFILRKRVAGRAISS